MNMKTTLLGWLTAALAFTGLILPNLLRHGMFVDDLWCTAIVHHLANGIRQRLEAATAPDAGFLSFMSIHRWSLFCSMFFFRVESSTKQYPFLLIDKSLKIPPDTSY